MKKSDLKKLIKTVLVEAKPPAKKKLFKYQIIVLVETEETFSEFARSVDDSWKDTYFYSDDFPGRVIDAKIKRV